MAPHLVRFPAVVSIRAMGDEWAATSTPDWAQGRATFGGVLTGMALQALGELVPADRGLRSVLVDFVAPVAPGDLTIRARVLRAGRALTQASAEIVQGGEISVTLAAAYGARRETSIRVAAAPPPEVPAPEELADLPYIEGVTPTFTQHFQYRWTGEAFPFQGGTVARTGGWVRGVDPSPVDAAGVMALIDAWPAPVLPLLTQPAPASTVTWMVTFHADPPPGGWPGDAWWRFEGDTVGADGGYADVAGRLWTREGRLVATSRQLVVEYS